MARLRRYANMAFSETFYWDLCSPLNLKESNKKEIKMIKIISNTRLTRPAALTKYLQSINPTSVSTLCTKPSWLIFSELILQFSTIVAPNSEYKN